MNFVRRQKLLLLASGAFLVSMTTSAINPSTTDEKAVLDPITAMFNGMATRNAAAITAPTLPGATMVLMHYGKTEQLSFNAFAERVGKGTSHIEERIHDPQVRIDHDLAVVWAPFEFRIGGKVDHCGTDSFSLVHTSGKWLIASLAATIRKDCGTK
jgi:Putative lumazine-binding